MRGNFDPAMSGVCRFACATKLEYKAADVLAQPGASTTSLDFSVDATLESETSHGSTITVEGRFRAVYPRNEYPQ